MELVTLEHAKLLKENGFSIPCEYFYQDKTLSFSPAGLKRTKNGKRMNHNRYDEFIYSAPTQYEAINWLQKKLKKEINERSINI